MLFNLFDKLVAEGLEVPVKEYIKKIESFDEQKMEKIITLVLDEKIEEAKELYNKEDINWT